MEIIHYLDKNYPFTLAFIFIGFCIACFTLVFTLMKTIIDPTASPIKRIIAVLVWVPIFIFVAYISLFLFSLVIAGALGFLKDIKRYFTST